MNYEDVPEIHQNEFTGRLFGSHLQLEVLGQINKKGRAIYVVKCNTCCLDSELFGDALYYQGKSQIDRGHHPCGCAYNPKWTEEQYKIIAKRTAEKVGYKFLGFSSEFSGHKTKLHLVCDLHGGWTTTDINHLRNGRGCPGCKAQVTSEFNIKKRYSDEEMVASFMETGAFHPETKFWRDTTPNKKGHYVLWRIYCPDCCSIGLPAAPKEIRKGVRTCNCSRQKQTKAYINLVKDGAVVIALKFGIAIEPLDRLLRQRSKSVYEIEPYCTYIFPSHEDCRFAENYCKRTLECGVVPKEYMLDGHSETTLPHNLEKIEEAYRNHGGILL